MLLASLVANTTHRQHRSSQEIGINKYEDLLQPCPREEIGAIAEEVRRAANEIYPGTAVEVMGSYRRGAKTGHDVDCLLTNPKFPDKLPEACLSRVVAALERR